MATELKPLFELIKPGVPCEVEYDSPTHGRNPYKFDGAFAEDAYGNRLSDLSRMMAARWRLVPPKPILTWDKRTDDLWISTCNRFVVHRGDKSQYPWRSTETRGKGFWHSIRDDAVQWCEQQAR